jgi:hypothetical protein
VKRIAKAFTGWSRGGRTLHRLSVAAAAFAVSSCVVGSPQRGRSLPSSSDDSVASSLTIVVLALDGVRYHEIFEGVDPELARSHGLEQREIVSAEQLMPRLHAIIATHGAALGAPGHGASISASGPNFLSLPGYAEIFSGRRVTDCHDNQCASGGTATVVDELGSRSRDVERDLAVITSWPEIAKVASLEPASAAISTGRHGGRTRNALADDAGSRAILERSEDANPQPGHGDFRPDRFTAELALYRLAHERPRFLFIGLGEPDEFGHLNDYRGYLDSLRRSDEIIARVDAELAHAALNGARTALFITTDHGRAQGFVDHGKLYPESARVWLVATGSACTARGFVNASAPRHLADIAPTVRDLAGLPADSSGAAGEPLRELFSP